MKKHFKLAALLLATATLVASCSKGGDNDSSTPNTPDTSEVSFSASISAMPSKATDTSFESGDEISVSAYSEDGSIYKSGVSYTYDSGLFTSTSPISYTSGEETLSFRALYPYINTNAAGSTSFSVYADQSSGSNYTLSDLMLGTSGETSSSTPELSFKHLLNKIVVNITSDGVDMTDVSVSLSAATSVSYDFSTLSYTPSTTTSTITMAENGVLSYKAIIVPQTISGYNPFGTITVEGEDFDFYVNDTFDLVAGCQYTINATVKKEEEIITVYVDFDSSLIADWEEGTLPEPVPEEAYLTLADFDDMTTYPTSSTWIITDSEASANSESDAGDFSSLHTILDMAYADGVEVSLIFENLTDLSSYAFTSCTSLTSISLPEALNIGNNAFYGCSYLTEVTTPNATNIGEQAFFNCIGLAEIELPLTTYLGQKSFAGCQSLLKIELPEVTSTDASVFYYSGSLASISLPKLNSVSENVFIGCSGLKYLELATEVELESLVSYSFQDSVIANVTLTTGSQNASYVSGNVLTVGIRSFTFKEIIIKD